MKQSTQTLSENVICYADLNCYEEAAIKEYLDKAERVFLILGINPITYNHPKRDIHIVNLRLFSNDLNLDQIPSDLKKIITKEFVRAYKTLNNYPISQEKVRVENGRDYDRGHPYIVISDAYSKGLINEEHPLLILVNERYKRETGKYIIAVTPNVRKEFLSTKVAYNK